MTNKIYRIEKRTVEGKTLYVVYREYYHNIKTESQLTKNEKKWINENL